MAGQSDACDVGGEEVDAVAVEVAAGSVVMLGGAGVGVAGEDLGVAQGDSGVESVGDRGVTQRVRADVSRKPAAVAIRVTMR
jgi:cobalamin biosynthesis protein CbiD